MLPSMRSCGVERPQPDGRRLDVWKRPAIFWPDPGAKKTKDGQEAGDVDGKMVARCDILRIAQVTATFPPYWGGTGNVVWYTADTLARRGHDITVFVPATRGPKTAVAGPYVVRPVPSPLHVGNAAWSPRLIHWLADFDLIHLHYPYIGGAEVVARAAVRRNIPLVVTYHNRLYAPDMGRKAAFALYTALVEPRILGAATQLIAVSEGSRRQWLARYRHVAVVGHGIDAARFHPVDPGQARADLGLPPDGPVILFVGALDRAHRLKNVDGLLTAVGRLRVAAHVVLVGDGDRRPALEQQAMRLGIASRVTFLGERSPDQLAAVYSAADVLVLPSLVAESFGLVLVESLACGTPVVASDLPGARDVLSDGGGWLVPPGDISALGRMLEKVLAMRASERQAVATQARLRVLERFTWPKVAESLESLYQTALDRHRASASLAGRAVVETSATKA